MNLSKILSPKALLQLDEMEKSEHSQVTAPDIQNLQLAQHNSSPYH